MTLIFHQENDQRLFFDAHFRLLFTAYLILYYHIWKGFGHQLLLDHDITFRSNILFSSFDFFLPVLPKSLEKGTEQSSLCFLMFQLPRCRSTTKSRRRVVNIAQVWLDPPRIRLSSFHELNLKRSPLSWDTTNRYKRGIGRRRRDSRALTSLCSCLMAKSEPRTL